MELIILAFLAVTLILNIFLAFCRGTRKSLWRLFTSVLSAVLAFFLARAIASSIGDEVAMWLKITYGADPLLTPLFSGEAGADLALGTLSQMLVAPLLFLLLFWALKGILFLLYWLLCAVTRPATVDGAASHFIALPIGIVIALISIFAFLAPVMGYLDVVSATVTELDAGKSIEKVESLSEKNTALIIPATKTPVASHLYGFLGDTIFEGLTAREWDGEKLHLKTELVTLGKVAGNLQPLFTTPKEQYGEAECAAVEALATSVGNSHMLSVLCSGLLNSASNKWMAGQDFFGIAPPDLGANGNLLMTAFLKVFATSTKENIAQDVDFFGDVFTLSVRYKVLSVLASSDENALAALIMSNGFLKDTRALIAEHPRMQGVGVALIDIGMRSALKGMGLPEDVAAECGAILADMTTALKEAPRKEDGSIDEAVLGTKLTEVFAAHEVAIGESAVSLVAEGVADEFTAEELAALTHEEMTARLAARFEGVNVSDLIPAQE